MAGSLRGFLDREGAHRTDQHHPGLTTLPVLATVLFAVAVVAGIYLMWTFRPQPAQSVIDDPAQPGVTKPLQTVGDQAITRSATIDTANASGDFAKGKRLRDYLEFAGWDVGDTRTVKLNSESTIVYYPSPNYESQAQAVVHDLGVGSITPSSTYENITVVLGTDYPS